MKKISDYKLNFQLFTFFINDISNYFEKRLVLKKIPQSIKILDDIKKDSDLYNLIKKNNEKEFDNKVLKKRKNNLYKNLTYEEIEEEFLNENKKIIEYKRNINSSSFGQRTLNIIKYFYKNKNEIIELRNILQKKIKDIILECYRNNFYTPNIKISNKNNNIINKIISNSEENKKRKLKTQIFQNLKIKKYEINIFPFQLNNKTIKKNYRYHSQNSINLNEENEKIVKNKIKNILKKTRNIKLINNNINDYSPNKNFIDSLKGKKIIFNSNSSLKSESKTSINLSFKKMKNVYSDSILNLNNINLSERKENNNKKYINNIFNKNIYYDYSNLISLRKYKLKSDEIKYPVFSLSKNIEVSNKDSTSPSVVFSFENDNKKKKFYSLFTLRNNIELKKKLKMKFKKNQV